MEENDTNEIVDEQLDTNSSLSVEPETVMTVTEPEIVNEKPKKKKLLPIIIIVLLLLGVGGYFGYDYFFNKDEKQKKIDNNTIKVESEYRMSGNGLEDFDISFLKLENNKTNMIYSPLSIKYALAMLSEASSGTSKAQIDAVIGDYKSKKYTNSSNLSLANALFVKESFKSNVKSEYLNTLKSKYNAELIYDPFNNPSVINTWVSDMTFGLVNNLVDDVNDKMFVLVNALAIDMEWEKLIQSVNDDYWVEFTNEDFKVILMALSSVYYHNLEFDNNQNAKSVAIAALANKYDIVEELGEDNIRKTVGEEYKKWIIEGRPNGCTDYETDVDKFLDSYIKGIDSNYGHNSSSTDFSFYDDAKVKVFSKDLKEYDGTTLQYIGIMPKNDNLVDYINNTNANELNEMINNIKPLKLSSFDDKFLTYIHGYIPMFELDYELDLMTDLNKLKITDVFDEEKADLSKITNESGVFIDNAVHKANIEFSNEGIKAAAATTVGGAGDATCGFKYDYEIPVKEIDLTFDKPFMYLIRDKETGEIWFTGTVYEPIEWEEYVEPTSFD